MSSQPASSVPTHSVSVSSDDDLNRRFRPVFQRIAEGAVHRESTRTLAHEQVSWLREAGFGAVRLPVELGGSGASISQLFRLLRELGAADSNLPQALRQHFFRVELFLVGDREQNLPWLQRVAAGELFGNATTEPQDAVLGTIRTVVAPTADGTLRLNGTKIYSTGNLYAQWVPIAAADHDGNPITVTVPADREGVEIRDDWNGFGQKLTATGTTIFTDVLVNSDEIDTFNDPNSLHGAGFHQLVLLSTLAGIAAAARDDAVAAVQAKTRIYFTGPGVLPRLDPIVQETVGEIAAVARISAAVIDDAARELEAAFAAWTAEDYDYDAVNARFAEVELTIAAAQSALTPLVLTATTALFDSLGASATDRSKQLDRHWRNARTLSSHNPHRYKSRLLGDNVLNGTLPPAFQAGKDVGTAAGTSAS